MHLAGESSVDAFRAWAAARSARILIFDSVAERPRYDDEGEHYEEDRVMPIVFGARRPPRVADKPVWL